MNKKEEGIVRKEIPSAFDISNDDLSDIDDNDTGGDDTVDKTVAPSKTKNISDEEDKEPTPAQGGQGEDTGEDVTGDEGDEGGEDDDTGDGVEVYDYEEKPELGEDGKTVYHHLAKGWVEDGFLPEDVEIKDDITSHELDELLSKTKKEPLRSEVEQEFYEGIREAGYTKENLETAKQLNNGVPIKNIEDSEVYEQIGSQDFTGDENKDERKDVLVLFYKEKGFSDAKAEKYADRAFYDESDEEELKDAQEHFLTKSKNLKKANKKKAEENLKKRQKEKEQKVSFIKNKLTSEEEKINGVEFPKELKEKAYKAFFEKSAIIEDSEGNKQRVTPYQKKMYERQNNKELELLHMMNIALDLNLESFKEYGTSRATSKIIEEAASKSRKKVSNPDKLRKLANRGKYKGGKANIQRRALN